MSVLTAALTEIPPQSGTAFRVPAGATLRIVDPMGEQVADMIAFAADDPRDVLSSGRSIDYAETVRFTAGHTLYSARSRPMLRITHDDAGRHDFLLTPCSRETFRIIYSDESDHPSCLENLARALEPFGIPREAIPTTFNAFMNVSIAPDGAIAVLPPLSKAGDRIEFVAEMDLIVGLTACSAEISNNYRFKPIHYGVLPAERGFPRKRGRAQVHCTSR